GGIGATPKAFLVGERRRAKQEWSESGMAESPTAIAGPSKKKKKKGDKIKTAKNSVSFYL
ncbi:MAG: hypothetical protein IJ937_11415, partial [Treponema sp.]|nr:hypothetical protein [Treponema sp.]